MTLNEKTTVGAQIMRTDDLQKPSYPAAVLEKPSMESLDSTYRMASLNQMPMCKDEYDPTSANPCSPFYSHPTTRTSFEQQKSESKTHFQVYEHDLESGSQVVVSSKHERKPSLGNVTKRDLCYQKRSLNPLKNKSRRQRLWIKIIIAILIVGAAVGLGIGIS